VCAVANDIKINLQLTGEQAVSRGMDNASKSTDKFGDSVTDLTKDTGQLTKKIAEAEAEIKKLTKAFDETGDMTLLKSIRKEQSNLRVFERLSKSMVVEAAEVGEQAGVALNKGLTNSLMASKGLILPPLVAAAAMAAPVIAAAISSAVVGAVGAGGIIGGIVAASHDQRVQDEAKRVADHVGSAFTDAGGPFVAPLLESLRLLDGAGDRIASSFEQAGTKIAPTLVPLTKGVTGMLDQMMPGIVKAMDAARPAIRALASELPKIGMAVSGFMDKISDDPDQAVMGIVAISQAIQGTIDAAGSLLSTLGDIFEWSSRTGAAVSGTWETLFGWLPIAGDHIRDVGGGFREQVAAIDAANNATGDYTGNLGGIIRAEEEVAKVTKTATEVIEDQIKAMDKMFGKLMDPQELASNYQEAIDELTKSVAENGKTLDLNSEAGRSNAEAIRNTAEAIKEIRNNTIENTGDVAAANTVYEQQVEALRKQMMALGFSRKAADEMAESLRAIPAKVDVEVRAPGLLEAIARAQLLNRLLGGNAAGARGRSITIDGYFYKGDDSGYGGGRAGGGPMSAGRWYTVGEQGVELVEMHAGGGATVHSAEKTKAMLSGATGGAATATSMASGVISGTLRYVGPSGPTADLAATLMTMFRVEIAAQGGNVQTVLGGG
jgi:hypothetical protein